MNANSYSISEEMLLFLPGAGPLEGAWFGDDHPKYLGNYWWRTLLRLQAQPSGPNDEGYPGIAHDLETARRDTERLDELERTRCYPFWNGAGWTYIVAPERSSKIERKGIGKTIREAIDNASRTATLDEDKEKP